jgi:hypothetical protein
MGIVSSAVKAAKAAGKAASKVADQAVQDRLSRMLKSTLDDGKKLTAAQKNFLSSLNPSDTKSKLMIDQIKRADKKITKKLTTGRKSKKAGSRTSEASPLEDSAVSASDRTGAAKVLANQDFADITVLKAGQNKRSRDRAKEFVRVERIPKNERTVEEQTFYSNYKKKEERDTVRAQQAAGQTSKENRKRNAKELPTEIEKIVDLKTGEIKNEAAYNNLTASQKELVEGQSRVPPNLRDEPSGTKLQKNRRKQIRRELGSKPKMMGGGMVGKKAHMYAAGGSVIDNRKKR